MHTSTLSSQTVPGRWLALLGVGMDALLVTIDQQRKKHKTLVDLPGAG